MTIFIFVPFLCLFDVMAFNTLIHRANWTHKPASKRCTCNMYMFSCTIHIRIRKEYESYILCQHEQKTDMSWIYIHIYACDQNVRRNSYYVACLCVRIKSNTPIDMTNRCHNKLITSEQKSTIYYTHTLYTPTYWTISTHASVLLWRHRCPSITWLRSRFRIEITFFLFRLCNMHFACMYIKDNYTK